MNKEELFQWISEQPDGRWPIHVDCGCDPVFISLSDIRAIISVGVIGGYYDVKLHERKVQSEGWLCSHVFQICYPFEREKGAPKIFLHQSDYGCRNFRLYCSACVDKAEAKHEQKVRQGLLVRAIRGCSYKTRQQLNWSQSDKKSFWNNIKDYKERGLPDDLDFFLSVPYSQKEEAKKLGAKWDPKEKLWFHPGCKEGCKDDIERQEIIYKFGRTVSTRTSMMNVDL